MLILAEWRVLLLQTVCVFCIEYSRCRRGITYTAVNILTIGSNQSLYVHNIIQTDYLVRFYQ